MKGIFLHIGFTLAGLFCTLTLFAQAPVVNLGLDFSACGSTVLDAGNSGATYIWSTSETTQQITVTTSDTYSVTVTNGSGSVSDGVVVSMYPALTLPSITSDTICAGQPYYPSGGTQDVLYWYDSPTASVPVDTNDLVLSNVGNYSYWMEGVRSFFYHTGLTSSSGYSLAYYDGQLSQSFTAYSPCRIDSVYLYGNSQGITLTVQLKSSTGTIIQSVIVTIGNGLSAVHLGFEVSIGNYELVATNISGGGVGYIYPTPSSLYPFTIANLLSITSSNYNGGYYTDRYYYFFNWKISEIKCITPKQQVSLIVLNTPIVSLPDDKSICESSFVLDPGVSGLIYTWTTPVGSQHTQTINTSQSGNYILTVSSGFCQSVDSVELDFYPELNIPSVTSATICAGQPYYPGGGTQDVLYWYDSPTASVPVDTNDLVLSNVGNYSYWMEGVRSFFYHTGLTSSSGYPLAYYDGQLSQSFTAYSPCRIDSVYLYGNSQGITLTVQLKSSTGIVVQSAIVTIGNGLSAVHLGFEVSIGDYELVATNISGGGVGYINPTPSSLYPFTIANLLSITSSNYNGGYYTDRYYYFFNWKVSEIKCVTPRQLISLQVFSTPTHPYFTTTNACGTVPSLSAQNPTSTYLWSTGETTQEITATISGDYIVTITNGGLCSIVDTASVQLFNLPATPVGGSTTLCQSGNVNLLTPITGEIYQWYNSPTDTIPIYAGAPFQTYISQTDTFYVEAASRSKARTGLSNHPNSGGGYSNFSIATLFEVQHPIVLDSVAVYVNNPCSFSLVLKQNGVIRAQRNVTVPIANTKFFVSADFNLPIGTGYTLSFSGLSGGQLATGGTCANLSDGKITILNNSLGNGNCYYFYDWSYSYGYDGCKSPKVQYIINVTHPFNLQSVVTACTPTVLNATSPNAVGYHWSNGASTPSITAMTAGTYIVTVTGISGTCNTIDSTTISLPLPVGLPSNGLLCGNTLQTNYTSSNATFLWENGATTATRTIITTGTYSVTVTTNGCVLQDQIIVTSIAPLPTVSLPTVQTFCNSGVLNAGNASSYTWSDNSHNATLNVNTPGIYSVTASNTAGCTATASTNVSIEQPATANFIYAISPNNPYRYTFTNQSTGSTNYLWDFGFSTSTSVNPVVIFPSNGTYTVHLIVTNSCGSDTLTQIVSITVGIQVLSKNNYQINIFPNPAEDILNIETDIENTIDEIFNISIIDMQGRELIRQSKRASEMTKFNINITNLASGVYSLQVSNARGGIVHKKFVRL